MAGPFNQHHRLPVRFSASDRDWMFGMKHDSLICPTTNQPRCWLEFLQLVPVHLRGQLLTLYANPMYADQLPLLRPTPTLPLGSSPSFPSTRGAP